MLPEKAVISLFNQTFPNSNISSLEEINEGGSDRKYFRIFTEKFNIVAAYSEDISENQSFVDITNAMMNSGVQVADIISIAEDQKTYLLSDLGRVSLLKARLENPPAIKYYQLAIDELVKTQTELPPQYKDSFVAEDLIYDKRWVSHDIMYFMYCFARIAGILISPRDHMKGMEKWLTSLADFQEVGFMYRDFQARNVMVCDDKSYLIDYQAAMLGPTSYDMASLLFQAKAKLSTEEIDQLWSHYKSQYLEANPRATEADLDRDFEICTFLRLVQVLGAYGVLGIVQKKEHFLTSIPLALQNLKRFLASHPDFAIPDGFRELLDQVCEDEFISKF